MYQTPAGFGAGSNVGGGFAGGASGKAMMNPQNQQNLQQQLMSFQQNTQPQLRFMPNANGIAGETPAGKKRNHEELYRLVVGQLKIDGMESLAKQVQQAVFGKSSTNQQPTLTPPPPSHKLASLLTPLIDDELNKGRESLHMLRNTDDKDIEGLDFDNNDDFNKDSNGSGNSSSSSSSCYPDTRTIYFTSHKASCRTAVYSPDGKTVVTGSADCSIKILDIERIIERRNEQTLNALSSGGGHNDMDGGHKTAVFRTVKEHTQAVNCASFHPQGQVLATGSDDHTIKFFDAGRYAKKSIRTLSESEAVNSLSFHPSGNFLLVGTNSPVIRTYDTNTLQCFASSNSLEYHKDSITHVEYAVDGKVYASCGLDGAIKLWDGVSGRCVSTFEDAHDGSFVDCVRLSRNMKYLLSSGRDDKIKLWDLSTGQTLITYEGGSFRRLGIKCSFSNDEKCVIGGDERSNKVVLWDSKSGQLKYAWGGHTQPIRCVATNPLVPCFVTGSEDYRSRFWYHGTN